jgi:hypothetical protein
MVKYLCLKQKAESTGGMILSKIKHYYDQILNVGTCRCLIGMVAEVKNIKITAFDKFSAYIEFYSEGITEYFT